MIRLKKKLLHRESYDRYKLRVRMSLEDLDRLENRQKLNDFLKAWKIIQSLPPDNPNSFWAIASFHGMPFKNRGENTSEGDYWGGYCQHGNVLFPTWHRLYLLKLEMALQTAVPDGDVALHYWDETSEYCLQNGLPRILLEKTVFIDGKEEKNPLLSFTLNKEIDGELNNLYKKPKSYETKRYPFSGIVNPLQAFEIAQKHNNKFNESDDPKLLNQNIIYWLNSGSPEKKENANSVLKLYTKCLQEQDYNKFSNTSSAALDGIFYTVEQPHNDIHLAVGGYTSYEHEHIVKSIGLIEGSNGDMGENETASFDPIFFLHHCFIDRIFWMWQKKWNHSSVQTSFEIYEEKSSDKNKPTGTSTDAQGPSPNQKKDEVLTMDTILYPFQNSMGVLQTSRDCVDIEKQLGYTYDLLSGSSKRLLSELKSKSFNRKAFNENSIYEMSIFMQNPIGVKFEQKRKCFVDITKVKESEEFWKQLHFGERETFTFGSSNWMRKFHLHVGNIDSNKYSGSILVRTFYKKENDTIFIGEKGILGRWEKNTCKNCQSRRFKSVHFAFGKMVIDFPLEINHFKTEIIWKNPYTGFNETLICDDQIEEHPKRSIFVTFKEL